MSMKAEVIGAMWLYGQEYSQGRLSAVDFYANLPPDRKRTVGEMVAQIGRAHAHAALEEAAVEADGRTLSSEACRTDGRCSHVQCLIAREIAAAIRALKPDATEEE